MCLGKIYAIADNNNIQSLNFLDPFKERLKTLSLNYNEIKRISDFPNMTKLENLFLSKNLNYKLDCNKLINLDGLNPERFPKLLALSVGYNKI